MNTPKNTKLMRVAVLVVVMAVVFFVVFNR